MYSLEDLEEAKAELARWDSRWANYSGNNPDKYQADRMAAARKVREIEQTLKDRGTIPLSEKEQLDKELDAAFPNAKSKEIVEYHGKKYRRRFWPLEKSRSRKIVKEWGRGWELVEE